MIADLELSHKLFGGIELTSGANNLFNKRPPRVALVPGTTSTTLVNGGYYYGRISFKF